MPTCRNPECAKEIPKGSNYCSEDCLRRHIELKQASKLSNEEDEWLGQGRRKRASEKIMKIGSKNNSKTNFVACFSIRSNRFEPILFSDFFIKVCWIVKFSFKAGKFYASIYENVPDGNWGRVLDRPKFSFSDLGRDACRLGVKELRDMIGATRESINKELKVLRKKSLIAYVGNHIKICDWSQRNHHAHAY